MSQAFAVFKCDHFIPSNITKVNLLLRVVALACLAVLAIFGPEFSSGVVPVGRMLSAYPPVAPLTCLAGEEAFYVNWTETPLQEDTNNQVFELENGIHIEIIIRETGDGFYEGWGKSNGGDLCSLIDRNGGSAVAFPSSYITMEIKFISGPIHGAFVSMGVIDSNNNTADAVRINMFDGSSSSIPLPMTTTGFVKAVNHFAYQEFPEVDAPFSGHGASLYAEVPTGTAIAQIIVDFSVFHFDPSLTGRLKQRMICPALNLTFCGPALLSEI